jgi:L-histidine N-alpha-methyltransferase
MYPISEGEAKSVVVTKTPAALREAVLQEALAGLSRPQKTLSPWLFYDEAGSHLFDQITELPEYYLTRTERTLFREIGTYLPSHLGAAVTIAELGAGSAGKTGILLRDFAAHQSGVVYQPIDISPTALDEAAHAITATIPGVTVLPQVANYITDGYRIERSPGQIVLAMYIGSSIGNFAPEEQAAILKNLREHLQPGDALLLGLDLAPGKEKSVEALVGAYDDAAGVTAAFNKNLLVRLNRELAADFDVDCFAHRALWNAAESRIEMHLESLIAQSVHIEGQHFTLARGETIHTENSYKFTQESIATLMLASGFEVDDTTHDEKQRYAVVVADAV